MSISIKPNDKPALTVCKMKCDKPLNSKLDKYELTKFLNQHHTTLLIGKPKSGKTSLLYSLFKSPELLSKTFHRVYLFQPPASGRSMKDNIFEQLPEDQKYQDLTQEDLGAVEEMIMNDHKDHLHCIIIDDMAAKLKDKELFKIFRNLVNNRRHLHVCIFFLVQTWLSVPKDIRRLFDNIFVFKVSKDELENIFKEVVQQKKDMVDPICRIVYDKPHEYLFINTDSQRLFKGFDELLINYGGVYPPSP